MFDSSPQAALQARQSHATVYVTLGALNITSKSENMPWSSRNPSSTKDINHDFNHVDSSAGILPLNTFPRTGTAPGFESAEADDEFESSSLSPDRVAAQKRRAQSKAAQNL